MKKQGQCDSSAFNYVNASIAELLDEVIDEGFKSSLVMMIDGIKEDSNKQMISGNNLERKDSTQKEANKMDEQISDLNDQHEEHSSKKMKGFFLIEDRFFYIIYSDCSLLLQLRPNLPSPIPFFPYLSLSH